MFLSLCEHTTTRGVKLSRQVRDAFCSSDLGIVVEPTAGTGDCYDLTPGSTVGVAKIDCCVVEVRPKLPIGHVLWMLDYGLGNARFAASVDVERHDSFIEVLISLFDQHLGTALRRGSLSGYVAVKDSLPTVRGRILFDTQIRTRPGTLLPIVVAYEKFTVDIEENRLLKGALTALRRIPIRSARLRARLRRWELELQDVTLVSYTRFRLPRIRFTRLNEHYRAAIATATLILNHCSVEARSGDVSSVGLLFDMNKVVEEFLVSALRESLGLDMREFPQGAHGRELALDAAGSVRLAPDFSWWQGRECVFVGDVKYKLGAAEGSVSNSDLYQMLAYCVGARVPTGMIVCLGSVEGTRDLRISAAGKHVVLRHLDITRSQREVLTAIRTLATEMRLRVSQCSPDCRHYPPRIDSA